MEYRNNPKNGNHVSLLGMGCMRLPVLCGDGGAIDAALGQQMVDAAYAAGVNYFDTAYPYHGGKSEAFIGKALSQYPRESYFLADKFPVWKPETEADLQPIFEEQLARCGVEYFDYYLCHAIGAERFEKVERLQLYAFLQQKKAEGKIRNIGFSFHDDAAVLDTICAAHEWDFAQLQINYLDWELQNAAEQYAILARYGIPCVVMEPVRGGALANLAKDANAVLKAQAPDKSIASWALRYAMSLENAFCVLSGMSNMEQITDNLATMANFAPLSSTEREALASAVQLHKKAKTVPCTACRYCMPCPVGVDIPRVFAAFNRAALANSPQQFQEALANMPPAQAPVACIACGKCAEVCPQHIAIPEKMQTYCQ